MFIMLPKLLGSRCLICSCYNCVKSVELSMYLVGQQEKFKTVKVQPLIFPCLKQFPKYSDVYPSWYVDRFCNFAICIEYGIIYRMLKVIQRYPLAFFEAIDYYGMFGLFHLKIFQEDTVICMDCPDGRKYCDNFLLEKYLSILVIEKLGPISLGFLHYCLDEKDVFENSTTIQFNEILDEDLENDDLLETMDELIHFNEYDDLDFNKLQRFLKFLKYLFDWFKERFSIYLERIQQQDRNIEFWFYGEDFVADYLFGRGVKKKTLIRLRKGAF